ncbi:MAG: bifunctional nuclease family protein [Anaerolineae bacterium]
MIEVSIDSVRVSLMSQHRVVVLKETDVERYLPIWIGPFEAEAIAMRLQGIEAARPLTHDLLKNMIDELGARVSHILVSELRNETFYARIILDSNGTSLEIDARTSDAIALAVRVNAPIFVNEEVMEAAGVTPDEEVESDLVGEENEGDLSVFREFVDSLDLDDLETE